MALKLSDLNPKEVSPSQPQSSGLKLSDIHPDEVTPSTTSIGQLEAILRGGEQGLTLGAAPRINAALAAGAAKLGGDETSLNDLYNQELKESRGEFEQAQKEHPYTTLASEVVGSAPLALLTGGAGEIATAGRLARGAEMAAQGGLLGAASGVARSEDLTDIPKTIEEAGKGLAMGAATGGVLGSVLPKIPQAQDLETYANEKAAKAIGIGKAQAKKLLNQNVKKYANEEEAKAAGLTSEEFNNINNEQNRIQSVGQTIRKEGVLKGEGVFAQPDEIVQNIKDVIQTKGENIGNIINGIDEIQPSLPQFVQQQFVNPKTIITRIKDEIQKKMYNNGNPLRMKKGQLNDLQIILDDIADLGNEPISFAKAQQLKAALQENANFESGSDIYAKATGIVKEEIEKSADAVANSLEGTSSGTGSFMRGVKMRGDALDNNLIQRGEDVYKIPEEELLTRLSENNIPGYNDNTTNLINKLKESIPQYRRDKIDYRNAIDALNGAKDQEARQFANRQFGITDYISAGGALAAGHPMGAVAIGVGNKLARSYGPQVQAKVASALAVPFKGIEAFTKMPAEAIQGLGQSLSSSGDELAQRAGSVVQEIGKRASENDNVGKNALIYGLMQDPSYREFFKKHFMKEQQ